MQYCLIEHLNDDTRLPKNCCYVALTQEAFYNLEKRNIQHILLEDYYTSGEIRGNTDEYLIDQLDWFDWFDNELKNIYPNARIQNLNLSSIYYYWLKYMVDNIILTSKIVERFIEVVKPDGVIFINNNHGKDYLKNYAHVLHFQAVESTYSRLFPLFCLKYNIPFKRLVINRKSKKQINVKRTLKSIMPKVFENYHALRKYFSSIKFLLNYNFDYNSANKKYNILYLSTENFIYNFSKDFNKVVEKNYLHNKGVIRHINLPFVVKNDISSTYNDIDQLDLNKYYGYKRKDDVENLYNWINNKCKNNVSEIVKTRMDLFIYTICPILIDLIPKYIDYYNEKKIDFIVASHIFSIHEHAALAATKLSKKTKSVYIHHGADAYDGKSRYFKLLRHCDYYFTTTVNEAEHEKSIRNKYGSKSPIIHHANYFSNIYF